MDVSACLITKLRRPLRPTIRYHAKLRRVTLTASLLLVAMAVAASWPLENGVAAAERGDCCASPQPGVAEPDLPLLQEGSARTAFISGIYKTCLERQRKHQENTILTPAELGQYCLCYGRAIAEIINAEEFEAITLSRAAPASFLQKTGLSAELCRAKMRPDAKGSACERDLMTVTGECSRTYFPQDRDLLRRLCATSIAFVSRRDWSISRLLDAVIRAI